MKANWKLYHFFIAVSLLLNIQCMQSQNQPKYNLLTKEEERVIVNKGTEKPFTGEFYQHNEEGTYLCKRCDAPLYQSNTKFDAHCGWPSFDDEIDGAVIRKTDADGHRTEILCANCGAHLGHVFEGEGFTEKNTRHCVNSISLNFKPLIATKKIEKQSTSDTAVFAGGCFWGMEYYFNNATGVIETTVGYIGGHVDKPTYEDVCSHKSGHIEAIEVVFNPQLTTFDTLARLFFEIHDPTQINRQGPDVGEQYKSAIFYRNEAQKATSLYLIQLLKQKGFKVVTELVPATRFWPAETYHQDYYDKKGNRPYCHFYQKKF
jgi:peptide methionine sulfoxide reductase msrA/msrB